MTSPSVTIVVCCEGQHGRATKCMSLKGDAVAIQRIGYTLRETGLDIGQVILDTLDETRSDEVQTRIRKIDPTARQA